MLFRYDAAGDVLVEARGAACRCCGDAQRMRAVDEAGRPVYGDGDCTQRASTAGCCDRKHWCRPARIMDHFYSFLVQYINSCCDRKHWCRPINTH